MHHWVREESNGGLSRGSGPLTSPTEGVVVQGVGFEPTYLLGLSPKLLSNELPPPDSPFLVFCKQRAALAAPLQKQREWKSVVGLTGLEPVTTSTQLAALPLSYSPCD